MPRTSPESNTGLANIPLPCESPAFLWLWAATPPLQQTGPEYCTWLGDNQALVGRQQEELPANVQVQARQAFLPAQLGDNADCLPTTAVILGTTHLPHCILRFPPLLSKKVKLGKEGLFILSHTNRFTPVPPSGMAAP